MDEKQAVSKVFNLVSSQYDTPALRFFSSCANKIVDDAQIKPGQKVLDVATGTGIVALAIAQAVGSEDRVHAIDLAEKMLDQAQLNLNQAGLSNVKFHLMDGEALEFESDSFDIITCSYGLFFMPDMAAALRSWHRVLKPGGKVIFTSFAPSAMQPLAEIFIKHLNEYEVFPPTPRWLQLAEEEQCKTLLTENGFTSPTVSRTQLGYHHASANDWWDVIQSAGYRGLYEKLAPEHRDAFQLKHLAEIETLVDEQGLWMDVETLISSATKPA